MARRAITGHDTDYAYFLTRNTADGYSRYLFDDQSNQGDPLHPVTTMNDKTHDVWLSHSSAHRINTDIVVAQSIAKQHPHMHLTIAPQSNRLNLLQFARAGHADYNVDSVVSGTLNPFTWTEYLPPPRRINGDQGALNEVVKFAVFEYRWRTYLFRLYVVDGRDGTEPYAATTNQYLLSEERSHAEELLLAAGNWANELHGEVWVFDQGFWQKSVELFKSLSGASWDNVILDEEMKAAIIEDHTSFFESRDTYSRLKVPWKRGIIYHGPPGNGKTISIKATMHMLYERKQPIPTLYVRSLVSFGGPERSLNDIFRKARQYAPCYLVFEDLDSIVSDDVRSYFLNEVDGLKANDGIFMVGSTNHLDRLDPGISKRPSRFDRKYFFPDPDLEQRIAYCKFWQHKLADNKDIEFPDELCEAIANITEKFSFAYIQEAFVAALLAIARRSNDGVVKSEGKESADRKMRDGGWLDSWDDDSASEADDGGDGNLDKLILWVEIKKQIKTLRESIDTEK